MVFGAVPSAQSKLIIDLGTAKIRFYGNSIVKPRLFTRLAIMDAKSCGASSSVMPSNSAVLIITLSVREGFRACPLLSLRVTNNPGQTNRLGQANETNFKAAKKVRQSIPASV